MKIENPHNLSSSAFKAAYKKIMEIGIYQNFTCSCGHSCNVYYRNNENKLKTIENCPNCNIKLVKTSFEDWMKKKLLINNKVNFTFNENINEKTKV